MNGHGFLNVHTAYYSAARVFQMEGWEFLLKVKDSHWNYQDRTVITKAIYNCIYIQPIQNIIKNR